MRFLTSAMIGVALAWLTRRRRNRVGQSQDEAAGLRRRLSTAQAEIARLQAQLTESEQSRQRLVAAGAQANQLRTQVAEEEDWRQKWSEGEAEIEQPRAEMKPPERAVRPKDRLEEINGIGPVFARRLNEAGIYTFAELAELTPERVHEIVHTEEWQKIDPEAWIAGARKRAQVPARP